MRGILFAALLAACAGNPRPADVPNTHAMYPGNRPPPLEDMAVLLVFSPADEDGKTLVGRITSDETGEDFRPSLVLRTLELAPGRYRIEVYYWVARSQLKDGKLVIENLQSGKIAPMEIIAEAGRTYYVHAEVKKREQITPEERESFFPLNYGATISDPESLRQGDSKYLSESEYVWRPHLEALPPDRAKEYRSYR